MQKPIDFEMFLQRHFQKTEPIIIACSGGPDSMYLVYKCIETSFKKNIVLCYFNHKTRKQTDEEEIFLQDFCIKNNLQFETASTNFETLQKLYPSKSFEELAREKRYQFLNAIMQIHGAKKVLLGHHRDDKIETFLFHLARGSKLSGLVNMQEISGAILRPLLPIDKEQILSYLEKNNLRFFIDETNNQNIHTRNKIRNNLIPEIKKIHPSSQKHIASLIDYLGEVHEYINSELKNFLGEKDYFSGEDFFKKTLFFQKELIRYIYYIRNDKSTIGLSSANINEVLRFMNGKNNKTVKEIKKMKIEKDGKIFRF